MAIRFFASRREIRRAETRLVVRFFAAMAILAVVFAIVVATHYLFGWW